jgi:hypothetical protein
MQRESEEWIKTQPTRVSNYKKKANEIKKIMTEKYPDISSPVKVSDVEKFEKTLNVKIRTIWFLLFFDTLYTYTHTHASHRKPTLVMALFEPFDAIALHTIRNGAFSLLCLRPHTLPVFFRSPTPPLASALPHQRPV